MFNKGSKFVSIKLPVLHPSLRLAFVLVLAGLACSLPSRSVEPTNTPVPTATVDPKALEDQLATASARFNSTGDLSITVTQEQLTAVVAQKLSEQTDIKITDPLVQLQENQVILSGKVTVGLLTPLAKIVFEPYVENGIPKVKAVSANFGSIPVPDQLLNQITDSINQNLSQYVEANGKSIEIESIQISDGQMTLTGKER
jgi:uncharacterized protein YpmS